MPALMPCAASFSLELGAYSDNGAGVFSRVSAARPKVGSYKVVAFGPAPSTWSSSMRWCRWARYRRRWERSGR